MRDEHCRRCGSREIRHSSTSRRGRSPERFERSEGFSGNDRERHRQDPNRKYDRDDARRDNKRQKLEKRGGEKSKWPPQFEKSGASYIFDARSGFFYEGASDFFFDPKTKLYYGNKQGKYFQYREGQDPPYQVVEHGKDEVAPGGVGETVLSDTKLDSEDTISTTTTPAKNTAKAEKKKIAISLKSKKPLGFSKTSTEKAKENMEETTEPMQASDHNPEVVANPPVTVTPKAQKQHQADIEKWSARGRESHNSGSAIGHNSGSSPQTNSTLSPQCMTAGAVNLNKVVKTAKGQPICILCRRKFASLEKLRQHEQVSDLHKKNLAKKAAAEAASNKVKEVTPSDVSLEYRDRAKERRVLYGPDAAGASAPKMDEVVGVIGPSLEKARTVTSSEVVAPHENLGESNIGNKMLQKLGWKKGSSLGRKDSSVSLDGKEANDVGNKLKEDWERIESLAGSRSQIS